ncbi:PREDICTED: metal tolerance protein 1-like isoform X1 [Nelumbo nucifera]|uniref:Metal tolerance protein 1-like isoform X1 n=1 Tax=Nelumbo nucifera TaxID=4432 RepID=A0A1U8B0E6_NELNU|nr:PREDICTED: metal tolerance protein 1-like isoform X1 [Nelumbo nucifera]
MFFSSNLLVLKHMEVQICEQKEHGQIIEISGDFAVDGPRRKNDVCGGAACGFSDAGTRAKDAKERHASMRKLFLTVALCIIFMSIEVAGGIKANSLAILTDAAHLLSDVASFTISLFSLWASGWVATPRQTYGFFRVEIIGALVSIQLIWLLAGILVYEAVIRIIHGTGEVHGFVMFVVAGFGLLVNVVMALLLGHHHHGHGHGHVEHDHGQGNSSHGDHDHGHGHHGVNVMTHHQHHNLNQSEAKHEKKSQLKQNISVQGAYLHVLGDSIQSIGVMIAGAVIWYRPKWKKIDLICTLIFSVIVLSTTIKMLRNILEILMESTPREIDTTILQEGLCRMEEVVAIHELHVWAITVGKILLACHVKTKPDADADVVLEKVIDYIRREHNITHVTIQIEK